MALTNCTAALHLAYLAVGVGPGDEVICPSLTFVATANAALTAGATVVLADVTSADDLTVDPADIERKITPRTKAIAVVHYAGYACDMDAILAIAERHRIAVIEDAAHAPLATYKGRALGTLGDVGCYSFFSNKNLSTGEGGAIVARTDELQKKLKLMRSHGMTTLTLDRHKGHAFSYDVVLAGQNYRIDEIRSAHRPRAARPPRRGQPRCAAPSSKGTTTNSRGPRRRGASGCLSGGFRRAGSGRARTTSCPCSCPRGRRARR